MIGGTCEADQVYKTLHAWASGFQAARQFRNRFMTDADRKRLKQECPQWERLPAFALGMALYGYSEVRAVVEIGSQLGQINETTRQWLLREFREAPENGESVQSWAQSVMGLVIDGSKREAYWNKEWINVRWSSCLWDYFLLLAVRAKESKGIDVTDVGAEGRSNRLNDRRSRLKALRGFPWSLLELIREDGSRRQRLHVGPQDIHLFHLERFRN